MNCIFQSSTQANRSVCLQELALESVLLASIPLVGYWVFFWGEGCLYFDFLKF